MFGQPMSQFEEEFKLRTRKFALRVINLAESLPMTPAANVIRYQLLRSGTSVGANYRAACRAKSRKDFIAKLGTVEEEADESIYWMELLIESNLMPAIRLKNLIDEANEIVSVVVASIKTARDNLE